MLAAAVASLLALPAVGCDADGDGPPPAQGANSAARRQSPPAPVFDYQLGGAYAPPAEVQLVVRDRTEAPAEGQFSVCYVNAFQAQPGEQGAWPEDMLLTVDGEHLADPDWPDEILRDRDLLTPESQGYVFESCAS